MAWTDPGIAKLVEPFIPAADEVGKLERGNDAAAKYFQKLGTRHVRGLRTTQGTYIVTASGILIDSGHTFTPDELADFLADGLKKYQALSKDERLGKTSGRGTTSSESKYPEDGLVLSVTLRKLYSRTPTGPRARGVVQWNQDFAWFHKDEAAQFLPLKPESGDTHDVPDAIIRRLARYHFTDTVRLFCDPYPDRCVKTAELISTVLTVRNDLVSLRLNGSVHSAQDDLPKWGTTGDQARIPRRADRSFDATLLGYATFDLKKQEFTAFELVAFGSHSGGGQRSFEDPVAIGAVLTLASDSPVDRVEPHHFNLYGW